jgi:hypothetical protein
MAKLNKNLERIAAVCPGFRLQMLLRGRRPIPRVPPLDGLPPGWTQEQGKRELSPWFWRDSRDGISRLEVGQKLGPDGEDGPWEIWIQTGMLSRGPISRQSLGVSNSFGTPLNAIVAADAFDEKEARIWARVTPFNDLTGSPLYGMDGRNSRGPRRAQSA